MELESIFVETLDQYLAKLSRNRSKPEKASQLKQAAANSFGVTFAQEAFTFQLCSMIEQLKFIESQVKETDKEIRRIMDTLDSVILSVPRIGPINGAIILGEIGDIHKFSNQKN